MKKGFTLIELLAVIVILAIIALIATPIILGIINDARKESQERSVELYASAVRNAIASYQLTHPNVPESFSDLTIQYDGNVVCAKEELYSNGSFYIADCTVNGVEVDYTYGTQLIIQVYKPQYYWFDLSSGNIGGDLPSSAKQKASEIDTQGKPYYIGLDVDANNKVSTAYVCFTRNETEYCLKGTTDGSAYATNVEIIKDAYPDIDECMFEDEYSDCGADGWFTFASSDGNVGAEDVYASDGIAHCNVDSDGYFECYEY